jgi:hypothetical protein
MAPRRADEPEEWGEKSLHSVKEKKIVLFFDYSTVSLI